MSHSVRTLRNASGFSLPELMTVVALIGILSAIAATSFTAYQPGYRVRGAALEIAGDMSIARLSAVKESRIYQFVPLGGGYQIRAAKAGGGWDTLKTLTVTNEFPNVAFGYTGVVKDPYGVNITGSMPGGPVTFHSNGTVVGAAGIFIQSASDKGTQHQAVTVTAAGRIRVWKYVGSKWQ